MIRHLLALTVWGLIATVALAQPSPAQPANSARTKIVLIAGPRSHGYGSHEFYAGCRLLADCLQNANLNISAPVCRNGWPTDKSVFEGADTIVVFADGGRANPVSPYLEEMATLMKRGIGFACLHYALQVPKGRQGDHFKQWLGGYYETYWSVNPHWRANITELPTHPVTRGVHPFAIDDEWYYHMRFRDNMQGVPPILSAVPPEATRQRPDGPHSGNPAVRARVGMPEITAWVCQRAGGGRGFGFSGGHWHWNWADDNFRTLVLNGIVWTTGRDVPAGGVVSKRPTWEQLQKNLDEPKPAKFDARPWQEKLNLR